MTKEQVIAKLNEILGEDVAEQFEEQEERASINGNTEFLVSNDGNLSVQVESLYNEELDAVEYELNEEWAK